MASDFKSQTLPTCKYGGKKEKSGFSDKCCGLGLASSHASLFPFHPAEDCLVLAPLPALNFFWCFGWVFFGINYYYYYCYYFLLLSWRARVDSFKPRGHIEFCQAMKRLLNNNNNNNNNENNGSNSANNCNSLLLAFGGSLQIGSSGGILGKNLDWSPPPPPVQGVCASLAGQGRGCMGGGGGWS